MYYLYIFTYITQPYIENAIELGIRNKEQPGNFSVRITKNEENLRVEIQDDGVGRQAVKEILKKRNSNYKSLSTGIIEERIKIFNRKSRNKISLEIIDLLDDSGAGCGTEVIIWFKSWWANPAQFSSTLTKFPRL